MSILKSDGNIREKTESYMNKCFITQWLLVLYLSLLVGAPRCDQPGKGRRAISLGLTLDTYAGEDSNAKEHEKAIHNLYVFIYGSDGRLENPDNTRVQPATDGLLTERRGVFTVRGRLWRTKGYLCHSQCPG